MEKAANILSEPAPVSELITYQEQAVVSRTILKNAAGTVTLFAFDTRESLSEHTSPYEALIHLLDGEAEITISQRSHRVRAGDILRLPANEPHGVRAVTPCKMLLTMLKSP